jgi:hypothetical protein
LQSFADAPCVPVATATSCETKSSSSPPGEKVGLRALPWCCRVRLTAGPKVRPPEGAPSAEGLLRLQGMWYR